MTLNEQISELSPEEWAEVTKSAAERVVAASEYLGEPAPEEPAKLAAMSLDELAEFRREHTAQAAHNDAPNATATLSPAEAAAVGYGRSQGVVSVPIARKTGDKRLVVTLVAKGKARVAPGLVMPVAAAEEHSGSKVSGVTAKHRKIRSVVYGYKRGTHR